MPDASPNPSQEYAETLLHQALTCHQAGDLPAAESLYRKLLEIVPLNFDATHLLGVVALQCGRLDEAEALISTALSISPTAAVAHNNLGNVFLRQSRPEEARACFDQAVALQPGFTSAHLNLGNALRRLGHLKESAEHLRQAVVLQPTATSAHSNLGAVLLELGEFPEAIRAFEQAVELSPDQPAAYANLAAAWIEAGEPDQAIVVLDDAVARLGEDPSFLAHRGIALGMLGRYAEALELLERVVELHPASAVAHRNLGKLLREAGEVERAISSLLKAVESEPQSVSARVDLIEALIEAGHLNEAYECLAHLLTDHPKSSAAFALQGRYCLERGDRVGAECAWRKAIALNPDGADVRYQFGNLLMLAGRADQAINEYRLALTIDSDQVQARWALAMAEIPPIPPDSTTVQHSREMFAQALADLEGYFDARRSLDGYKAVGSTQPFYLAYQAQNNRELLARYGRLCSRLMTSWQERNFPFVPGRPRSEKIRVGIASAHIYDHSVWHAIVKGWVRNLDRDRFEVVLFLLGDCRDSETQLAIQWADEVEHGPGSLSRWVHTIAESSPDVLIYPEIGMHAMTTRLASLRLARVQAVAWGHPETTGLPTMDYYLSAAAFEPEQADAHYTERLVTLPHLGVCYEPQDVTSTTPDLRALGLPDDVPLLLCAGQPFKYAPDHDALWAEISRRAAPAILVFFDPPDSVLAQKLAGRLRKSYHRAGLDFERCVRFIHSLSRPEFYGLLKRATALLDTPGFSGFNTAIQAVECGIPVLARESAFMRGRFASGILRSMGLDALVATSDDTYVDLAVRLVRDDAWNIEVREDIEVRRSALFGDQAPIRALEEFLSHVTAT